MPAPAVAPSSLERFPPEMKELLSRLHAEIRANHKEKRANQARLEARLDGLAYERGLDMQPKPSREHQDHMQEDFEDGPIPIFGEESSQSTKIRDEGRGARDFGSAPASSVRRDHRGHRNLPQLTEDTKSRQTEEPSRSGPRVIQLGRRPQGTKIEAPPVGTNNLYSIPLGCYSSGDRSRWLAKVERGFMHLGGF
ncbi:hypothetical protein ACJZ2D_016244 [Fusarium nematophilum]